MCSCFIFLGLQKGNVANQREHLILLLANVDVRNKNLEDYTQLDSGTGQSLMDKFFKNYRSWCDYLHCNSNLRFPDGSDRQQLELLYIGLYLLIWGEASNIRFMPECICYIFHNMVNEVYGILYSNIHSLSGRTIDMARHGGKCFLRDVVTPIFQVICKEAKRNRNGKASNSTWRNYDDLNEYFWSEKCFQLGWPMDRKADFFAHSNEIDEIQPANERPGQVNDRKRMPKANFVEVRTFWHLFRSFDKMWIFFSLALQAMVILAWNSSGSFTAFDEDVFKSVLSIFITSSLLNFLQAILDIILTWNAWRSLKSTQILRFLVKFTVAAVWILVLSIGYAKSAQNPTGLVKTFSDLAGGWWSPSFYYYSVAVYLIPNILEALLFFLPLLRRSMERSNRRIVILLMWWTQPRLYVGRGMHEDILSILKYTLFWIMLIISKLSFSYYVEVLPLVGPTKLIMSTRVINYEGTSNIGLLIAIWAPVILVYFMDAQIWYAIFSMFFGWICGVFSHLGEIQTLGMLRSRFKSVPLAFSAHLIPMSKEENKRNLMGNSIDPRTIAKFSLAWNEFIHSMRIEDLISHRERDLLLVPYSSSEISFVQWPAFLLVRKIPIALEIAKDFKGNEDAEFLNKIKNEDYVHLAVIECYETLRDILNILLEDEEDKMIIRQIYEEVNYSIQQQRFLTTFRMSGMPLLINKLKQFLIILLADAEDVEIYQSQIINLLQDIVEIIIQTVMKNGPEIFEKGHLHNLGNRNYTKDPKFDKINVGITQKRYWREKFIRLQLLLTSEKSAINVPMNSEARRRITFFTKSLSMNMPAAPKVRNTLSFSVLTPYYKEDVLYSEEELLTENEDGISILFSLQKIYPDEWTNFCERIKNGEYLSNDHTDLLRLWASYRGQTLSRTVRGMMYYKQALELQCFLDIAEDRSILGGYRSIDQNDEKLRALYDHSRALADLKFTYVVSCQIYGAQKISDDARDQSCYQSTLNLMLMYPALRVAFIDEREETVNGKPEKVYYSVLVKGGDKLDEEIYRIKLPGCPTIIGEGKYENQNHAIIFTRGEALQITDMNQDNYLEEAFKMRNVLEEFLKSRGRHRKPTILDLRKHIFTGSVSSLASFVSNQETSFKTIDQQIFGNPLRMLFQYGHSDIFDRIFHLTRGGISKASKVIDFNTEIFSGFNSCLRGGYISHHEYIQVGKGRAVGMNQISVSEALDAKGNGEQTLNRAVYRLGRGFDFFRMLSFYFTTIGVYFSSMVALLVIYVFLYGRLYVLLSGLERTIFENASIHQNRTFKQVLATQSIFQLGLLLALPMVMEICLERGFCSALSNFIIMQLQLVSVFFTFQLGTKAHYYGRTILHGGFKHYGTSGGLVPFHVRFADNYRLYSRSHFVKALELIILLLVYQIYEESYCTSSPFWFITFSMWFLVASWLFAPFVFNPSGVEWQKTMEDWADWKRWMGSQGHIGFHPNESWGSWWDGEQEHLKNTDIRGTGLEIILALRFFLYQYGIVCHLIITHHGKSFLVYGLSWVVNVLLFKMVSFGRPRICNSKLKFSALKGLLFLCFISVMIILVLVCGLTISDLFVMVFSFVPTGWGILLIAQACKPLFKRLGLWDSIENLARAYEYMMGLIIFIPLLILSWFPFISVLQTRLLFLPAFSKGIQISMILAGKSR